MRGGKGRTIQRLRATRSPANRGTMGRPSSNAVAAFEFVKAQLTGEKPNLGENRKVTVSM